MFQEQLISFALTGLWIFISRVTGSFIPCSQNATTDLGESTLKDEALSHLSIIP
jgi:hypothetical protein